MTEQQQEYGEEQYDYNQQYEANPEDQQQLEGEQATEDITEQAEKAKNQFVEDLKNMTDYDEAKAVVRHDEDITEDPRVQKFSVTEPKKVQGFISYTVQGEDSEGEFTVNRRFKEFFALKNVLKERWPGVYIPAIPEKKALGNKDDQFIEERRALLERFMKEIAKYEYLVQSQELKIFARDHGDVEKVLQALPKQTPLMILEKYRINFQINEDRTLEETQKMKQSIQDFHNIVKSSLVQMEKQKLSIKSMIKAQDERYKITREILDQLAQFEEGNVEFYAEQQQEKKLLSNPANGDLKQKMEETIEQIQNPFNDIYIWIKGELLDLQGIDASLVGRDLVIKTQGNMENKRINNLKKLDEMKAGKKSLGSMFKSADKKEKDMANLESDIKNAEGEIEDYKQLVIFLTLYTHDMAIEKFKKTKMLAYAQMMNNFSVKEISNSHSAATFWHNILENAGPKKD